MARRGQPTLQLSSLLSDLSQLSDPGQRALLPNLAVATSTSPSLPTPLTPSLYPISYNNDTTDQANASSSSPSSSSASKMAVALGDEFLASSSRLMDSVESEVVEKLSERITRLESTYTTLLTSIGGDVEQIGRRTSASAGAAGTRPRSSSTTDGLDNRDGDQDQDGEFRSML